MTENVCKLAATAACETSYRAAAKTITETTGLSISQQGVWNIVQQMGESQKARIERHAELAQHGQGVGVLETKLLYEENDGIWLKLQGKDRKQYGYFSENKEALLDPYKRGIEIPETYAPGEVHHARLGSMESNVFTLVGNRMKDGRCCWSIRGGNHLVLLLTACHTSGLENLFAELPAPPKPKEEWKDTLPMYGASKVPEREGHGYDYCHTFSLAKNAGSYLSELCRIMLRGSSNNF